MLKDFFLEFKKFFRSKNFVEWTVFFLTMLLLTVFLTWLLSEPSEGGKAYDSTINRSSLNSGSSGTMAMKEFLESLDIEVIYYSEPLRQFAQIRNESGDFPMLLIEPKQGISQSEISAIKKQVSEGARFILISSDRSVLEAFLPPFTAANSFNTFDENRTSFVQAISEDNAELKFKGESFELLLPDKKRISSIPEGWITLAADEKTALVVRNGGGLVLISDSSWISNRYIAEKENAALFYSIIDAFRSEGVYVNEYIHGFHRRYTVLFLLLRPEYRFLSVLLGIGMLLLVYSKFFQFGQLRHLQNQKTCEIYAFSLGMSGLLSKKSYTSQLMTFMVDVRKKRLALKGHSFNEKLNEQKDIRKLYNKLNEEQV
jgi:hypothetical protein